MLTNKRLEILNQIFIIGIEVGQFQFIKMQVVPFGVVIIHKHSPALETHFLVID